MGRIGVLSVIAIVLLASLLLRLTGPDRAEPDVVGDIWDLADYAGPSLIDELLDSPGVGPEEARRARAMAEAVLGATPLELNLLIYGSDCLTTFHGEGFPAPDAYRALQDKGLVDLYRIDDITDISPDGTGELLFVAATAQGRQVAGAFGQTLRGNCTVPEDAEPVR